MKTKSSKGLTLIELMVVLGIISIVIAIALPNFVGMQRRAHISGGTKGIAMDFRQARERALAKGIIHQVTFDSTYNWKYTVSFIDTSSTAQSFTNHLGAASGGRLWFGCATGIVVSPPEGSGVPPVSGIDFPNNTILFNGRGGATKGVVYITDGRETYAVGVNTLGKIRVYAYGGGKWY